MAKNTYGFKLGIEGEQQFKSKLTEVNKSMKVLSSDLKRVKSEFEGQDRSVSSLTATNDALKRSIEGQKEKIKLLTEALENAAENFGENDSRTKDWQIKLNEATAALNKMEHELNENEQELEELEKAEREAAEKTDKLGDEAEQTGNQAKKAGRKLVDMKEDAKGLKDGMDKAAAGIKKAALAIGAAIAAAGAAMVKTTVDAAEYADEILETADVTGMSTESIQAYTYAAELLDVEVGTITKSLAKNTKAMSEAANGSKKYTEAYAKLGVQVTDANGELRKSEDVFWDSIDALGAIENETERDALSMQLFGKSAQDLNPLIIKGSEAVKGYTDEAKRMGAVLDENTLESLGALDDDMQRLKQGFKAAKTQLGTVLLPELKKAAEWGIKKLQQFSKELQNPQSETRKLIDKLKECAKVSGSIVFTALKTVADVLLFLFKNIKIVVPVVGSLVTAFLILRAACSVHVAIAAIKTALDALPATATKAQASMTALSTAMSTNVIGAIAAAAAALAMLTVAIVGLCTSEKDTVKATPEFVQAAAKRAEAAAEEKEAAEKAAKAYWELIQKQSETAKASEQELEHVKKLTDELFTLADEKGKVKKADEARAKFILGELNNALGTEYELTNGQIKNYKKLKKSIYEAIEAKKAQIYLDAYEPAYREALQQRIELEKEQAGLKKRIAEQTQKCLDAEEALKNAKAFGATKDELYDLANAVVAEGNALAGLREEYKANEGVLIDYYGVITDYESASTELLKGNTAKTIEILDNRASAFVKATDLVNKTADEQKKILFNQYETMYERANMLEEKLRAGIYGVTQEMVDDAKAMAKAAGEEYEAVGGTMRLTAEFVGAQLVNGMAHGINERSSYLNKAMRNVVKASINAAKAEAQIASPSRKMRREVGFQIGRGAELGIMDSTGGIKAAVVNQMRAVQAVYRSHAPVPQIGDMSNSLRSGFSSLVAPRTRTAAAAPVTNINVYARDLSQAQVDYLITRVNLALGAEV